MKKERTLHSPAVGRREFLRKGTAMAVSLDPGSEGLRSGFPVTSAGAA